MIQSGKLRHQIVIQKRTLTSSGFGASDTESWSTRYTVRAEYIGVGGKFRVESAKAEQEIDCIWRIRYQSAIQQDDRVKWGSRYFRIEYMVNPSERNLELKLYCKEIT